MSSTYHETPGRSLASLFSGEKERLTLWLPVFFASGIGGYFALSFEPPLWLGAAALGAFLMLGLVFRRGRPGPNIVFGVVLSASALAAGFTVAQWRTALIDGPMITRRIGPTGVTGRIVLFERFPKGSRVTLEKVRIIGLAPARTPQKVRLRLRGGQPDLSPGDWVRLRAVLSPPSAPVAPGAFDFQRQSFFRQLGGVGFALGPAVVIDAGDSAGQGVFTIGLAKMRRRISERIFRGLEGNRGVVAAALMTGERKAVPAPLMKAIRDSGLAHLLSISGLHVGLVSGILFFGLRAVLALFPVLALRYPIKKWAAGAAILGALAYSLIAGATVPTQRAFLMVSLVLAAVLLDRRGLSMRTVAWAAAVILLFRPESLLGPSFQLSFAAVTALIAAYELLRDRDNALAGKKNWITRLLFYLAGVAFTTLIAGLATAPFALYHFNTIAAYGLVANLIAVPVTALWTMPWAVVSFLLMPFGLETLGLAPMGWGIGVIIDVARAVSSWPGAVSGVPAMPVAGLVMIAIGGLWLCLWRTKFRFFGVIGLVAGAMTLFLVRPPDILIEGRGKLMAVRTAKGGLALSSLRKAKFTRKIWLRRMGLLGGVSWSKKGFSDLRLSCDGLGCLYRIEGKLVALAVQGDALMEDCQRADIVLSAVPVRRTCPSAGLVIDRFDLWRNGAYALWFEPGGTVRVQSVNEGRGKRPWVIFPEKRKKY